MSKIALIDSNIFIWGIQGYANEGQESLIKKSAGLIGWLSDNKYKLLLPVPQLVELMSHVPVSEQHNIKEKIDGRFLVAPFDELSASKCAELIHRILTEVELKEFRKQNRVSKTKLKYDCMLVSTAIVRRADRIYTHDPDIKKYGGSEINVIMLEDVPEYYQQAFMEL